MFSTKFTKKSVKGKKPPSGFRFAGGGLVGSKSRSAPKPIPSSNYSNTTHGPIRKKSDYAC